jgi:hypothetical protein
MSLFLSMSPDSSIVRLVKTSPTSDRKHPVNMHGHETFADGLPMSSDNQRAAFRPTGRMQC